MRNEHSGEWHAEHYDAHISYVSRLGKSLLEVLEPKEGERILDLGCGTGDLASEISSCGAECVGLDSSEAMVKEARRKYPDIRFVHGDGHSFRFPDERPFDAVFSNAALHWMTRPGEVAESIRGALRPGGRFVAELGGQGNVARIRGALSAQLQAAGVDVASRNPWYFPSLGEYTALLERYGLEVRFAELFDRPTPFGDGENGLRHWLDAFAGRLLEGLDAQTKERIYEGCEKALRAELYDGIRWIGDYRRLRVLAVKV